MKCEQCSGPITLEEEFCPHCGALNKEARRHLEDMKRFNADYEQTKSKVMANSARQGKRHAQIITLIVMAALNIIVFVMQANYYEVGYFFEGIAVNQNSSKYENELDELESEGDYTGLYKLDSVKDLYLSKSDKIKNFSSVISMSGDYFRIMQNIYNLQTKENNSYDQGSCIQSLAYAASAFYGDWNRRDNDYLKERYEGNHLTAMDDMKDRVEAMLKSYCGLTDEDLEKIPDLSEQEVLILIGRRMGIYD